MSTDMPVYTFYGGSRGGGRLYTLRRVVLRARFDLAAHHHKQQHANRIYPLKRPMWPVLTRNRDPRVANEALLNLGRPGMYYAMGLKYDPLFGLGDWPGGSEDELHSP